MQVADYTELKLALDGHLKPGEQHRRNVLLDSVYASLPKDPQAKVLVFTAEIVPGGYTNWHCHNGATFFVCTQGQFEAHFQEGTLVKAKAGDVYSEPIARFHRGYNPHPELTYSCVGICLTSPDREHITSAKERPW
ncbi:MAG TPA: cupin domain-containing protein [Pseudolabrys sp.]|nr:cupin domain-containing protein [Pseudolabrys sp.]